MENPLEKPKLKIETVKTPDGNEVSFCPERGGIITSIKFKGKEVLYLDEATLHDPKAKIRGGIQILFPNAGLIESPEYPKLKQHGFARDSAKWQSGKLLQGFGEVLMADTETMEVFPYNFSFYIDTDFDYEDGSFTIKQSVTNKERSKEMPISMGLHPYFKVPDDKKREIKFNFEGGEIIEKKFEVWSEGGTTSIDNPNTPMEIIIPGLGTLVIDASPEYEKIWIWSLPGKDFICIEPVMRDKGGLIDNPQKIEPEKTFYADVKISLKK